MRHKLCCYWSQYAISSAAVRCKLYCFLKEVELLLEAYLADLEEVEHGIKTMKVNWKKCFACALVSFSTVFRIRSDL
jgi:hypothetical protein